MIEPADVPVPGHTYGPQLEGDVRPSTIIAALSGRYMRLRFHPDRTHTVEIVERPGLWLDAGAFGELFEACRTVASACLGGGTLNYGLFAPEGEAWNRSVVTLVRRTDTGKPIAFNAMPLLPVTRGGQASQVLHMGLVMVDPDERGSGLSWILYGLTCFALFVRGGLRPWPAPIRWPGPKLMHGWLVDHG